MGLRPARLHEKLPLRRRCPPGTDETASGFPAPFAGNSLAVPSVPGFRTGSPDWFFAPVPGSLLRQVDHAAAGLGAASALHPFDVLVEAVIHRQLLAAADGALANVEDVALQVHGAQVGIATVVDDLGARAAECAVERPVIVQREQVSHRPSVPPLGLAAADSLARVLDDLAPSRDGFLGVDPAPVDLGLAYGESELGQSWIDRRCLDEHASHCRTGLPACPCGRIKKSNPIHRKFYLHRPNPRRDNIGNCLKFRTGPTMNLLARISALALLAAPTAAWAIAPDINARLAAMEAATQSAQSAGDNAWMLVSSALVLMMTAPGLALFYGGLVRRKNVLGTMMHSFILMAVVTVIWAVVGYSLAFGGSSPYFGNFQFAFLNGVGTAPNADYAGTIPHATFMVYQLMFAIITPALISGAFAERMKFSAMLLFTVLWTLVVYFPMAHMVWGKGGLLNAFSGGRIPCFDFAGGTVVHITSGVSALVCAIYLGKRIGFPGN